MKCPGYSQSLRWVTKHELLDNNTNKTTKRNSVDHTGHDKSSKQGSTHREDEVPSTVIQEEIPITFPSEVDASQIATSMPTIDPTLGTFDDSNAHFSIDTWDTRFGSTLPELEQLDSPPGNPLNLDQQRQMQKTENTRRSSGQDDQLSISGASFGFASENTMLYGAFSPSMFMRQSPLRSPTSTDPSSSMLPPLRRSLEVPSSTLVEYYFKEVAGLFSSYDSHMNPFRTTVSRLWTSSPVMCRTLQSMAAASLVDDFPQFGPIGIKLRQEAITMLEKQTAMDDKSLLAMLMLGLSASWHNPNDLGISFFNLLRKHLDAQSNGSSTALLTNRNNYQFFEEALVYWEMLLSYVADHSTLLPSPKASLQTENILSQRVPHPWTGIARDTQFTVHEVGRLIRQERQRMRHRQFISQSDIAQAQRAIKKAEELEERLMSLAHPAETEVVNPGDDVTPVWHLLVIAEVYRFTGLLQLYRIFPDLLSARLRASNMQNGRSDGSPEGLHDPFKPMGLPDTLFNANHLDLDGDISPSLRDEWLTSFALTAMNRLKTIPLESRTRCLQPFLLVASSSELRLPPINLSCQDNQDLDTVTMDFMLDLSPRAIEISRVRKFVIGRLEAFLHVLPPKPIHVCLKLVREVWRRMDAGEQVYWMDVMMDEGLETTMG